MVQSIFALSLSWFSLFAPVKNNMFDDCNKIVSSYSKDHTHEVNAVFPTSCVLGRRKLNKHIVGRLYLPVHIFHLLKYFTDFDNFLCWNSREKLIRAIWIRSRGRSISIVTVLQPWRQKFNSWQAQRLFLWRRSDWFLGPTILLSSGNMFFFRRGFLGNLKGNFPLYYWLVIGVCERVYMNSCSVMKSAEFFEACFVIIILQFSINSV